MNRIRVLIVDDQMLMRQGLATLLELESDLQVAGQASDGMEAVALVEECKPHVVLMDVRMPRLNGVDATRQIRSRFPETQVIILTTFDDDEYVFEGLRAGAMGYLLKDVSAEELTDAVRRVARGEALIQPSIARKVVSEFARLNPPTKKNALPAELLDPLSERELGILKLLAQGMSNREIAETLFITEGTAKNHISNIFSKLGVRDRTQAVLRAQQLGLV